MDWLGWVVGSCHIVLKQLLISCSAACAQHCLFGLWVCIALVPFGTFWACVLVVGPWALVLGWSLVFPRLVWILASLVRVAESKP